MEIANAANWDIVLWCCVVVGGFLRGSLPAPHPAPPLPHFSSGNVLLEPALSLATTQLPSFGTYL